MSYTLNLALKRYHQPFGNKEAISKLANALDLPKHFLRGEDSRIAVALAGTIMYRQLSRLDRISVMQSIQSLSYRPLIGQLVTRCTDPMVQHQWAEWSMTN
ncbi:hypothetical protein ACFSJ3_08965 [Corallincola platygyrae]|uniref:Uncharacterized protein n=1 Tax=Corallincola platygyrae TaxID=1193278 RepID=A0ABW4XKN5_9GAMM